MEFSCDLKIGGEGGSKERLPGRYRNAMALFTVPTIGFFWDFENIRVPKEKSGYTIVQRLRQQFLQDKSESEFIIVCDIRKEKDECIDDLNQAHVKIVHVRAIAKNSCDEKLKLCMSQFVQNNGPGSTIVLLSSDVNFAPFLSEFRNMKGVNIIIVHNVASEYLLNIANEHFSWNMFIQDLPPRRVQKPLEPVQLIVTGLLEKMLKTSVKKILSQFVDNTGGKVVSVKGSEAKIQFASAEYAIKAKERIENEKIGKRKIKVAFRENLPVHTPTTETFDESIGPSLNIDEDKKNKSISLLGAPTGLDVNRPLTRAFVAENQQSGRPLPTGLEDVNIGASTSGMSTRNYGQMDSSNSEDDEPQRNKKSKRLRK